MPSSDTLGKIADETNSVISLSSLETKPEGNLGIDSDKRSPDTTPAMVVRRREFVSGGPSERNSASDHFDDRCVNVGLGSHLQPSNLSRLLECGTKDFTYQHPRDGGSDSECSTLPYSVEREGDSTSLRQYRSSHLHKQTGGTKSPSLCMKTWQLFKILMEMSCTIIATHLEGIKNVEADHLSRHKVLPTEWCLNSLVLQQIFQFLGNPLIDLFAPDQNHCLPTFCSWRPSVKALAIDAFTLDWSGMIAYAYPPICLIPRVLQQVENQECIVILIAPFWPKRAWFTKLLSLTVIYHWFYQTGKTFWNNL